MKSLIAILNKSTVATNDQVKTWTQAVAYQVKYHACPPWGKAVVPVIFYSVESDVPAGAWKIYCLDTSDQQGALGYHDETSGLPYGRIFVKTCQQYKISPSSCLSHEVLEALIDPNVNLWADSGKGYAVALEVGDPVENDSYLHNGVELSNFVLPAWFDPQATPGTQLDYMNKTKTPYTMSPKGYIIVMTEGKVSQKFGEDYPEERKNLKGLGSRTSNFK